MGCSPKFFFHTIQWEHPSNTIPMIRKFLDLCKHYYKISQINEYQLFFDLQKEWNSPSHPGPCCGASCDDFHKDGSYERDFITYHYGSTHYHKVTISCVACSSCGHSHALLPSVIIPYSSYSIQFVVSILFHYYKKTYQFVEALCPYYGIAISTLAAYYKRVASEPFRLSGGKELHYKWNSLSSFESDYRRGGFEGVIQKQDVSVNTIQRYVKRHNLKGANAPGIKDRKAFEEVYAGGLYQADTLYGPYIAESESPQKHRTYCIMILDDETRMIVGGKFFYAHKRWC